MVPLLIWLATAVCVLVGFKWLQGDLLLVLKKPIPMDAWVDKRVWVIGASQGMGALIATYFAERGAKVVLSARNEARLQTLKNQLPCPAAHASVVPVDLCGSFQGLEKASQAAMQAFDGLDYVVHCVGASMNALAAEVTPEVTDKLFAVNTLGPIKLTRALLPIALESKQPLRFVVIASMAAKVPSPGQSVYSACKAGLYGYFSSLSAELADTNIGVSIICPGPVGSAHAADTSRAVYGATGLISSQGAEKGDKARMDPHRCVWMISKAAYYEVDEAWISQQPVIGLAYIFQYLPALGWLIMKKVGPKRAKAMKEGKSGYKLR